jgi:hypothetical protein
MEYLLNIPTKCTLHIYYISPTFFDVLYTIFKEHNILLAQNHLQQLFRANRH